MNTSLKYGLIGGAVLSSIIFFYLFGLYEIRLIKAILTPTLVLALLICILLGVKEKKATHNHEINLRDAVFTGLSINFIIALIQSAILFIFFSLSPGSFSTYKDFVMKEELEKMKAAELFAPKDILKNIEIIKTEMTPFALAKSNFMEILIIGLIISLIIAFFQRNKFDATVN